MLSPRPPLRAFLRRGKVVMVKIGWVGKVVMVYHKLWIPWTYIWNDPLFCSTQLHPLCSHIYTRFCYNCHIWHLWQTRGRRSQGRLHMARSSSATVLPHSRSLPLSMLFLVVNDKRLWLKEIKGFNVWF